MKRGARCLLLLAAVAGPAWAAAPDGWRELARLKAELALKEFAADQTAQPREAEFGRAVSLLARSPVTPEQVNEAKTVFAALADGSDEVAQASRYFLGRIAQHHQEKADRAEAARQYRRLLDEHGESIWAQTALTRLVVLELYPADESIPPAERLAAAEKLMALARRPVTQSELHLVLADAIFYYNLPAREALPHLLAAERLGLLDVPTRADVLVQTAEVSRLTGNPAQARQYYETFLKEYTLDQRQHMVRVKLRELDGKR